ncbi:type II toxin-antitoxin system RelE family toxin [Thioalkalicoccus limnaeus]|uniref:type II toxin-antitoxin system RelE family toxin n=1 Tax=Thioalkalicoccus limnaeus TaxID=120681 RepID=UPI003F7460C7
MSPKSRPPCSPQDLTQRRNLTQRWKRSSSSGRPPSLILSKARLPPLTIPALDDPRRRGKPLVGDTKGLWPYRVGDYRILCELRDNELIILVVTLGHRRQIDRKP